MKPILLLCLAAFLASILWIPVIQVILTHQYDVHKPFWEISHYDHIQWGVLFLEWGLIAVMGLSARMLTRKNP